MASDTTQRHIHDADWPSAEEGQLLRILFWLLGQAGSAGRVELGDLAVGERLDA